MKNKLDFLKEKHKPEIEIIPETYRGVNVGDIQTNKNNGLEVPTVIDDIELDDNEKKVMNFPPKNTVFQKLLEVELEVDIEECFMKMRWDGL